MWCLLVDKATGRLVSQGTVVCDPVPSSLDRIDLANKPDDSTMWDAKTRTFVPRPIRIARDLVEEMIADSGMPSLSTANKDKVRTVARRIFGEKRFE